jgi:integrase
MTTGWIREGLQSLIRSVGLRVETFASAQEFLIAKRPDAPSCLILDVRMPGLSGLEQLRPLLERLKIPHGTLQSFRHARVSHLGRQAVPDPLIKKWAGSSSLRSTDLYTHFDAEHEQKIAAECGLSVPN